ncbi:EthD family reductase [Rhodoferax ferrireducens]|uniref:EthD family reductase n=1 Tax=Rhodoferax ferrireducens TaxID=192843 RepID=UPI003BB5F0F3
MIQISPFPIYEAAMVKISILYPNSKGSRFDLSYYSQTHMPMAIDLLGTHTGFKGVSVEHGLGGAIPGTEATYVAMCHYHFDAVESFMAAFTPHAATLQNDMQNYTDIEPVIQVNEVLIAR